MTTVTSTAAAEGDATDETPRKLPSKYTKVEKLAPANPPPDNELSIFKVAKEILSTVKPGSDVTNINLPASVLDPISTLEKTKTSMQRGELIQDVCALNQEGLERLKNVMRFNLSGLARERFGKKPFNPVLGEIYRCCFVHRGENAGVTLLVAEQVSHHPPITALHLRNDALGFTLNSHIAPDSRFWGNSLEVKLAGLIRINLARYNEEYLITRPDLYVTGFIAGRQRIEFNGMATIECKKSGLGADVEYKAKGAMTYGRDMNAIQGRIYEMDGNKTLYTLAGNWDKIVTLTDAETGEKSTLFDYEATVLEKSMVAITPSAQTLEESFSTKVWKACSTAILAGETMSANNEKRKVEEGQRRLRKERAVKNDVWQHHYFRKRDEDDVQKGWDLRGDLKRANEDLVEVCIDEAQLKGLRSGELVQRMLKDMATEEEIQTTNAEASALKGYFRRKFVSRR